jgi:hypothetical protein
VNGNTKFNKLYWTKLGQFKKMHKKRAEILLSAPSRGKNMKNNQE